MIIVVGIGAGGMAGLSDQSKNELLRATTIYGSSRQLDLLDDTIAAPRRCWPSPMLPALERLLDDAPAGDIHVVASGDPLLHGVGTSLIRLHGTDNVRVLPHVSSVTLACARMGWAAQDTEIISLVTAPVHTAVRRGGQAVVLSRDAGTPAELARLLTETGRGTSEFTVLEQLGGPSERVRTRAADSWAAAAPPDVDALNVIAVRYLPDDRVGQVLPDDLFRHDGQITKQTIRAVTLAALAPRPGELLWDVGAGSGSIAVEWCRSAPGCRAVAFEADVQRRERVVTNSHAFGVAVDVRGAAPEDFGGAARPDAIFVGGGLTKPGLLSACVDQLSSGGRLVANAVTAESEALLVEWYSRLGGELRRFQHYRGEPLGGFTGWRPAMPITQWAVTTL
ncbi:precorrin-6y C5,15-methyltransferase (decarboxylating) subunit CbiE [Mycolicibacterium sp. CH28]|uniref:precorrin-6y C5,15-methyltransferase (decarboxylating) subunit CbiE n=1 Tax=Mycolicibacterium sp. CH28 TaxID=2512237 RepID=UPI0010800E40|nr:precorrin-6y C5,15-methyltransferase (decarboxylating) subunit CbiE [Mycolicibacterium sp. CH28]TGD86261.1 precorrin-6y C5,15-methyltransferase (decarboxylating) subunit CbiE [Mycolicibacterium sp. CH28]